jgi:outer membrane immunogenic protein
MKKVLLGGVALITLGFVGAAVAADMPVKAPPPVVVNTWTGFYVGINFGGGWYKNSQSFSQSPDPGLNPLGVVFDPVTYNSSTVFGAQGGVHAGYNWQLSQWGWQNWLIGVEGDWDKTNVGNSPTEQNLTFLGGAAIPPCLGVAPTPPLCHSLLMSQNLEWTASVRGRLGYTWGSALIYGTGGAAWASEERSAQVAGPNFNSASIATSFNTTQSGWVGGGGLEVMATANWLVRIEYLHYQFSGGSTRSVACSFCTFGSLAGPGNFTWNNTTWDVVRAGLSYKF